MEKDKYLEQKKCNFNVSLLEFGFKSNINNNNDAQKKLHTYYYNCILTIINYIQVIDLYHKQVGINKMITINW